jgi:diguanylate cyclase (GGDEF)-like protein
MTLEYNHGMVLLQIAAWSLPELLVATFAMAVWLLGFSLKPANDTDATMLRAYRTIILTVALVCAVLFLQHSNLVPAGQAMWWCYLLVATLVPLGTRYANYSSGLAFHPLERLYWGISAIGLLALVLRSDLFVLGQRINPFGYPQANAGWVGLLLIAMHCAVILVGARRRTMLEDDVAFPGGHLMTLTWIALALTGVLEQLTMVMNLPLPPVFWIGVLMLSITFTRIIHAMHLSTSQALEHTLGERNALRQQVIHDELTGLASRSQGELELTRVLEMQPACVLFIDLDDFKRWNDQHSHATGDRVLRAVAQVLQAKVRASDIAARYAGDEFFLALLGANLSDGMRIAHEIETGLEALRFEDLNTPDRVRASVGVVHVLPGETATDALHRADLAAYQIKRERKRGRATRA